MNLVWITRARWVDGVYWCERDIEVLLDEAEERRHPPIMDTAAPGWPDVDTLRIDWR